MTDNLKQRMMNYQAAGGREIEIERSPTPAEIDERRDAGRENDVNVPRLQAQWASFALAAMCVSLLLAILSLGWQVLFVAWLIVGTTTFLWWMWRSSQYAYTDEYGREHNSVTILDFFVGCGVTLFSGGLAWCLWRVASLLMPPVHISLPWWLQWLGKVWRYVTPIVALVGAIFSVSFWLHIELAFVQKLAQKSVFQEQHIWAALGALLAGEKPPWWFGRKRPPPEPLSPPVARAEWVEKSGGGTGKIHRLELPIAHEKAQALAEHILDKEQPFSETACCRTTSILSQTEYQDVREWMLERGFARWSDPDNHRQGSEVTAKGRALLRAFLPKMAYEKRPAPPYGDNGDSFGPQ